MVRDPVQAENQVVAHVHVHQRHGHRLAELVAEAQVDQHLRCKPQRAARGSLSDLRGVRLTRGREAKGSGEASIDEAVRRAGVEQDGDAPQALSRREERRQAWLEVGVAPPPCVELGHVCKRRQARVECRCQVVHRVVDPIGCLLHSQVVDRLLWVPRPLARHARVSRPMGRALR